MSLVTLSSACCGLVLCTWLAQSADTKDVVSPGIPGILDCTYDPGWNEFRTALRRNVELGSPFDEDLFEQADRLISKNIITFLAFHRSKSNEFFHDCDREEPRGVVCLYGMLCAFLIHHIYLRHRLFNLRDESPEAREVFTHSTSLARLMLMNKNNCLDFFDSSGWPFSLEHLIQVLRPEDSPASPAVELKEPLWSLPSIHSASSWQNRREEEPLVVYIAGTHVALVREPAEMLARFVGPLLGREVLPVLEIADDQHCSFLECAGTSNREEGGEQALPFPPVGLRELAEEHFQARWNGLDILDFEGLAAKFEVLFRANPLGRRADVLVCTTPAVLCALLAPFDRPMMAYLGEPLLLSVREEERGAWFTTFEALARREQSFFACYNPYLAAMIEYQTGLTLPVIRMHGLYTDAVYSPTRGDEVLVVKGPNICADSACLLNRFFAGGADLDGAKASAEAARVQSGVGWTPAQTTFIAIDELGGAPYRALAAFRAVVLYPYDVALAIFYELYSMCMPLLVPRIDLLPFYVYRGLHSHRDYHWVQSGQEPGNTSAVGAGLGPSPFFPAMDYSQWFRAGQHWSQRTDFARFPHLLRFGAVAELLVLLAPGGTDWPAVSAGMRKFNDDGLVQSAARWAGGVRAALAGEAGVRRAAAAGERGWTNDFSK